MLVDWCHAINFTLEIHKESKGRFLEQMRNNKPTQGLIVKEFLIRTSKEVSMQIHFQSVLYLAKMFAFSDQSEFGKDMFDRLESLCLFKFQQKR